MVGSIRWLSNAICNEVAPKMRISDRTETHVRRPTMKNVDGSSSAFVDRWPRRAENQPLHRVRCCDHKVRYETRQDADAAVHAYQERVVFTTMVAYRCAIHECWHIGHNRFMRDEEVLERARMPILAA